MAGEQQPAAVHALAPRDQRRARQRRPDGRATCRRRQRRADATAWPRSASWSATWTPGKVRLLLVLGEQPGVRRAGRSRASRTPLQEGHACASTSGLYHDETAELCQWHVPATHYLESWGDARAVDGTVSIMQPLIAPAVRRQVAARGARHAERSRRTQRLRRSARVLTASRGSMPAAGRRTASQPADAASTASDGRPRGSGVRERRRSGCTTASSHGSRHAAHRRRRRRRTGGLAAAPAAAGVEIDFSATRSVYDGRFANNGWLQELPKPLTKLTWDNAALIAPATAERLGRAERRPCSTREPPDGRIDRRRRSGSQPGHARRLRSPCSLGYGRSARRPRRHRRRLQRLPLRGIGGALVRRRRQCAKAGGTPSTLVSTQDALVSIEGRDLVRSAPARRATRPTRSSPSEMEHMKLSDED